MTSLLPALWKILEDTRLPGCIRKRGPWLSIRLSSLKTTGYPSVMTIVTPTSSSSRTSGSPMLAITSARSTPVLQSPSGDHSMLLVRSPVKLSLREESSLIFVHLAVPPDILDDLSSSDTLATEGMRVVLNCHAEGNPAPAISWRREDGKKIRICNNLAGRTRKCQEDLVHYGSHLELSHISRFDSGVYLCIATNGVPPSVSKRVRLYVDCKTIKGSDQWMNLFLHRYIYVWNISFRSVYLSSISFFSFHLPLVYLFPSVVFTFL